jgi:PTH1 family peptidyl-tRNA hydrolase
MWLVVGLGNPEPDYARDRHNVGFMVLDELASWKGADPFRKKFAGKLSRLLLGEVDLLLLKPWTYMNESGNAVQPAAAFYRIPTERILVIHDEVDLPCGTVRLKQGGGHAGHNGLRSIISRLGTAEFGRVRVGIGRPPEGFQGELAD